MDVHVNENLTAIAVRCGCRGYHIINIATAITNADCNLELFITYLDNIINEIDCFSIINVEGSISNRSRQAILVSCHRRIRYIHS
jgi:hypothetical protein